MAIPYVKGEREGGNRKLFRVRQEGKEGVRARETQRHRGNERARRRSSLARRWGGGKHGPMWKRRGVNQGEPKRFATLQRQKNPPPPSGHSALSKREGLKGGARVNSVRFSH